MTLRKLTYKRILLVILILPLSIWLLFVGFKNDRDPYWAELDGFISKDYQTLTNSKDSIQALYNAFHGVDLPTNDSLLTLLIAKPFMPTMEFSKLKEYFSIFNEKRSIMFSAVTGSGNTTLVDRIANIIASKPENKMVVLCAPQFDMEFNKKYIGYVENERLVKGDMLKFWDKCWSKPKEKFVCVIDKIDKINPETFFGPQLWEHLDDPKGKTIYGKDTIMVPPNFYLICITQWGVGQRVELTNEHLRRLGGMVQLPIHPNELILFLRERRLQIEAELVKKRIARDSEPPSEELKTDVKKLEEQLTALKDTTNVKKIVYFFAKSNEMIVSKYSYGHQIGQWSDIRKYFLPKDFDNIKKIFINNVNAYRPNNELKNSDFDDILYSIKHDGAIHDTSPIWKWGSKLADLGFASELGVAGSLALFSAIFGWFYFRKRHLYVKDFTQRIYVLMDDYEHRRRSYDQLVNEINAVKREFDGLVLDQKVNYNEAAFFYGFLEDKTRYVEMAREINQSFLKLMDAFLDDNILTDSEYSKLNQFLESIRYRIATPQYLSYKEEIERIYKQFGVKKGV